MRTIIDNMPKRPSTRWAGNIVKQIPIKYIRPVTKIEKLAHVIYCNLNKQSETRE
ncbi:hypothetical protein [Pectinatus brassicae]|uniref:Uncharacterized protein n=1 Tax=Pectinatus brassicae TaxID=862415 RepID=A0A840UKM8_9FIRM|nr:hypothetical protein [Pectinatus brassicae]MBB5337569.1 hypothetical protein [Pectinatus brassicae]